MSRALQRLRRMFDDALLVSGRDGYALTPRAERIQSRLAAVLPELDALFGGEHFDPMTAQESYRLELSDYSVAAFGADLARTIRTESPGSTLAYQLLDDGAVDHLSTGEVDLLILGRPAPTQFSSRLLFTDRFVCAGRRRSRARRAAPTFPARLPTLPAHQDRYRAWRTAPHRAHAG